MKRRTCPRFIILIVCVAYSAFLGSGLSAQTVSVQLLKDEPDHLPGATFIIDPLYVETWKPNGSAGMALGGIFHAGRAVDIDLSMQMGYAESKRKASDNPEGLPVFHDFGLFFGLNFANIYSKRIYRVRLQSSSAQSYTYVEQEFTHRSCLALRGGVDLMGSAFEYSYFNTKYSSAVYHDTVSLTSGKSSFDEFSYVVGLSLKSIYGGVVSVDGSTRKVGKWSEFYFDGLIGAATIYDKNYKVPGDTGTIFFPKIQSVGYRMGWRLQDPIRPNVRLGVEFGCYPGPALPKQTHYFLIRFGFTLTDNAKYCRN